MHDALASADDRRIIRDGYTSRTLVVDATQWPPLAHELPVAVDGAVLEPSGAPRAWIAAESTELTDARTNRSVALPYEATHVQTLLCAGDAIVAVPYGFAYAAGGIAHVAGDVVSRVKLPEGERLRAALALADGSAGVVVGDTLFAVGDDGIARPTMRVPFAPGRADEREQLAVRAFGDAYLVLRNGELFLAAPGRDMELLVEAIGCSELVPLGDDQFWIGPPFLITSGSGLLVDARARTSRSVEIEQTLDMHGQPTQVIALAGGRLVVLSGTGTLLSFELADLVGRP
jgi:hypothetical protein